MGETTDDYAVCGYAFGDFGVDEGVEVVSRSKDALFVFLAILEGAERFDVVPSRHMHAHVLTLVSVLRCISRVCQTDQGDGNVGRIREDERDFFEDGSATVVLGEEEPVNDQH